MRRPPDTSPAGDGAEAVIEAFVSERAARDDHAEWLLALDAQAFRDFVADDCRNRLDESGASALRHPLVLKRWQATLALFREDGRAQVDERTGGVDYRVAARHSPEFADWYRKYARWAERVKAREGEAGHLIAEQRRLRGKSWEKNAQNEARQSAEAARLKAQAEVHAAGQAGTSKKVRKRIAGDIAIGRLIELHSDEWERLLDEEYAAAGTPDDIRNRVAVLVRAGLTFRAAETFARESWPVGRIAYGVHLEVNADEVEAKLSEYLRAGARREGEAPS